MLSGDMKKRNLLNSKLNIVFTVFLVCVNCTCAEVSAQALTPDRADSAQGKGVSDLCRGAGAPGTSWLEIRGGVWSVKCVDLVM